MVHLAILLIGAGVVASQVYQQETQATPRAGRERAVWRGYTIVAHGIQTTTPPGRRAWSTAC